jgi:putative radical SAM enzyme (TIGR03279 family)
MEKHHKIKEVAVGSIAAEMGITSGDVLLEINGTSFQDVFDYQFLLANEYVELLVRKPDGEEWLLEIDKDENEDIGLEFAEGLMDEYRLCQNKCIFCFIDQMPLGLRETLYFKDDDARLSFLQGNYVTLTNMSDDDILRIIRYRLAPINISIHTTNPELRCMMLNNKFAGEALKKIDQLHKAKISMNGQIVLCKGVNDEAELSRTIDDLIAYLPYIESVSVVPAGLTKYRENLYPLQPYTKDDAVKILEVIHRFQSQIYKEHETHFIHASDEWYMLAGDELPTAERYDGYLQLENGVGMMRLLLDEFEEALDCTVASLPQNDRSISIATGFLAYKYIKALADRLTAHFPALSINVYSIANHYFGENITVSGLLTGIDLVSQLKDKPLGQRLLLPINILRHDEDVFLDGFTIAQLEKALQVPVDIVKSSGRDFIEAVIR